MPAISAATNITSVQLKESAAPSTPASGYGRVYVSTTGVLRYINDAATDVAVATTHPLLDGTVVSDSLAGSATRGDILYANSTPKWARLAKGAANTVLLSDGTDVGWSANVPLLNAINIFTGLGLHQIAASGTGLQFFRVRNSSAGATNGANVQVTADNESLSIAHFSSTFTPSGNRLASGGIVEDEGVGGLSISASGSAAVLRFYTSSTLRAQINNNGTQTWAPYGAGAATFDASGNITSVSDARYKDRIAPLPYGLAEVLQLCPVQHGYNELSGLDRTSLYGGFLAQDVQKVMPLAIGQNPAGYLTLADRPILGAVVQAIQTIAHRLTALETR